MRNDRRQNRIACELRLARAKGVELGAQSVIAQRQHGHRKQGRIGCTCIANGKGGNRDAFGHLHNAVQRIDTAEVLARHRYTQHWQHGLGGQHSRQVCCTTGTGNDGFEAPPSCALRIGKHIVGHTVRREHLGLMRHAKLLQNLHRVLQRLPVGGRPHHHGDIRELLEGVRYAPIEARYKVYIIDEVHMLSTGAFNALLKTLEEPPPHAKFIFATTEIRKVPVTILSRTQRFDLRRVEPDVLVKNLEMICENEGARVEAEGLMLIARAAEGSVRDGQSTRLASRWPKCLSSRTG